MMIKYEWYEFLLLTTIDHIDRSMFWIIDIVYTCPQLVPWVSKIMMWSLIIAARSFTILSNSGSSARIYSWTHTHDHRSLFCIRWCHIYIYIYIWLGHCSPLSISWWHPMTSVDVDHITHWLYEFDYTSIRSWISITRADGLQILWYLIEKDV